MRSHVDRDLVVGLTAELVEVDTRNPPGGEAALTGILRSALDRWGPRYREVEPAPGRLSLIAALPQPEGDWRRPTLVVNGHTDVVPVVAAEWTRDPFRATLEGDRLYGRGTADMKGGIAAAICALDTLHRAGRSPACDLVFHLVADEETGGRLGTRALLEAGELVGDACLVPEPTGMAVGVAERGQLRVEVIVRGRPGHGSRPREGVSAIEHGARLVLALHAADFGDPDHPLLGRPTANVGTISGGSGINTVAELCRLGVDRRVLPGVGLEAALDQVRARIESAGVEGLDYELQVIEFAEASEMRGDHPFAEQVAAAIAEITGSRPPVVGMTFTTDARFVRNQAGIPAVVCGPGELAQAHSNDEWVSVERLVDATAAYAALYASFA